jgi:anti-anti-sigma factor
MRPLKLLIATAPSDVARLSVTGAVNDGVLNVTVRGELDMSNAGWFAGAVIDMMDPFARPVIVVDIGGLRFLDAAGIRALLLCARYAAKHDGTLNVGNPQPIVCRVLRITGLEHMIGSPDAADRLTVVPSPCDASATLAG